MENVKILEHPLLQHKISRLRMKQREQTNLDR